MQELYDKDNIIEAEREQLQKEKEDQAELSERIQTLTGEPKIGSNQGGKSINITNDA